MPLPKLPQRAAYLLLDNATRRHALSLAVLESLHSQLSKHLTSPQTDRLLLLPPFIPSALEDLERTAEVASLKGLKPPRHFENNNSWLVNTDHWNRHLSELPSVIVLRTSTPSSPIFSSGHDLREIATLSPALVRRTFTVCADLMTLLRRSPIPVVSVVDGLATAAGCQLALSTDICIASDRSTFQLPGVHIGLPCTSPATALARRLPSGLVQRMLLTGEAVSAVEMAAAGGVDVARSGEAFNKRVADTLDRLAGTAAQPRALGKWAFWTQIGMRSESDGYEEAAKWAGRVMALHAMSGDAREGVRAFLGKREAVWKT